VIGIKFWPFIAWMSVMSLMLSASRK